MGLNIVHFVDKFFGIGLVMSLVLMATGFWRGAKRSRRRKLAILAFAHLVGIGLVTPTGWAGERFAIAVVLLALMVLVRYRSGRNPLAFLLRVAAMGAILALEILLDLGKGWLPLGPEGHLTLQVVGIGFFIAGLGIAIWAKRTLGSQLAIAGTTSRTEVLVDSGPFALVRHPLYSGAFLVTVGLGVVMRSPIVLVGGLLLVASMLNKLAYDEERRLLEAGIGYADYQARVPRYVPKV